MAAPLIPQEIFLLERYTSRDYFERLVDAFAGCVKAGEDALAKFMRQLPPDYRSRPLWQQPDATWGEVVLPNLRTTLSSLNIGLIKIANGDMTGLEFAGNVGSDFSAILRDYDDEWMSEPELSAFEICRRTSSRLGTNIFTTAQRLWVAGDLTNDYQIETRGELDSPPSWPIYRLITNVSVDTGSKVPSSGIYLPDHPGSSAQLLIKGYNASKCGVPRKQSDPAVFSAARDLFDTTWVLVERAADTGGSIATGTDSDAIANSLRCVAGDACPKAGWWITPAGEKSRRQFSQGEIMPSMAGDYGRTIWQWDVNQEP